MIIMIIVIFTLNVWYNHRLQRIEQKQSEIEVAIPFHHPQVDAQTQTSFQWTVHNPYIMLSNKVPAPVDSNSTSSNNQGMETVLEEKLVKEKLIENAYDILPHRAPVPVNSDLTKTSQRINSIQLENPYDILPRRVPVPAFKFHSVDGSFRSSCPPRVHLNL